jgi:hypothetical protein
MRHRTAASTANLDESGRSVFETDWDFPPRAREAGEFSERPRLVAVPPIVELGASRLPFEEEHRDEEAHDSRLDSSAGGRSRTSRPASWAVVLVSSAALLVAAGELLIHRTESQLSRKALAMNTRALISNGHWAQAQLDSSLQRDMIDLDQKFVDKPTLDPYFNGRAVPPATRPLMRARVLAMGNRVIDLADEIASYMRERTMSWANRKKWASIMRDYFNDGPAVRLAWRHYAHEYSATTACILGAPTTIAGWNWKTNSPRSGVPPVSACDGV